MKQTEYAALAAIVDYLEQLCAQGASGTLFLATKTHLNAQIALNQGRIVFIQYQGKRGLEAVQQLQAAPEARYRFQAGLLTSLSDALPAPAAIYRMLRGQAAGSGPEPAAKPVVASGGALTQQQKSRLESCLAEYVGPVAALLVQEHCRPGLSLAAVVEALAAEVLSAKEVQEFRKKMLT